MIFQFKKYSIIILIITTFSCNTKGQLKLSKEEPIVSSNVSNYGAHDKVTSGILDKAGNLWFGTNNEGVYRYVGKSFVNFTVEDGLPNNYVNCMVEDRDGNIWIGTQDGLSKYDGNSFTNIRIPRDSTNDHREDYWWNPNDIQCMLQDRNGDLWIGTGGFGSYRYDGKTFTNFSFTNDWKQADSLHHNFINSMIEDTDGNIWFTSLTHGGVSRYDGKNFTHFSTRDGLQDDMVFSSFQDKAGNLWFGSIQTKYAGLYKYDGKSFTSFGKEDGLCDNFVTGFFEDKNGKLWIRTGSILCMYDGNSFLPFISEEGKHLNGISFIEEDKEKNIWLGGQYGHLWKYDGKTLIDFTELKRQ